eukprot:TRINITY_DN510_c0_g1_i7.p1 TRINITY_DN510_c0_g1~~TRINITY_DN510_c0_g1_i7.p1  ORF type:complete len:751 (+),score=116.65 TRINITY_DN510_c0_g1_i7:127-2379(+)
MCIRDRYQRRVRETTRANMSVFFLLLTVASAVPLHDQITQVPEDGFSADTRRAETYDFTTCGQQGGCLEVSVVQNSPAALCNTGKCDYRVCVSIKPNCGKKGTMKYSCKKPEDQCTATTGFGAGLAEKVLGKVDQAIDLLDDQSEDRFCQTVKGGETAQFMYYSNGKCVDDGSSPGDIAAQTKFTSGVVATCSPRDSSADSCDSESREGDECVWSITAPECRCSTNNGGCEHHCNSNAAGFMTECTCKEGYQLNADGVSCDDVNECVDETHNCDTDHGRCHNTRGGFECSCGRGFVLNADERSCESVNQCAMDNGHCEHTCENTAEGYSCSCKPGYTLNNSTAGHGLMCDDINECDCANPTHNCDEAHGRCRNTVGGFTCACDRGYQLNPDKHSCGDIDECLANNGNCEHTCENTVGGYSCSCKPGFQLSSNPASHGFVCDDFDECRPKSPQDPTHNCDAHGSCHNTVGGFTCSCDRGYQLNPDGHTCDDVDECSVNNGNCEHTCENTVGGHHCTNGATHSPTEAPTETPTEAPTQEPTRVPTQDPTLPFTTCLDWHQRNPSDPSGQYVTASGQSVYCDMDTMDGGWTLALVNGENKQHKNVLRYGANPGGIGDVGRRTVTGAHKMAETTFDTHQFTELLVVNHWAGSQYVWRLFRPSMAPFTSEQAFSAHFCGNLLRDLHVQVQGGTTTSIVQPSRCNNHGPLFHDPFGVAHTWMWTDNSGTGDLRKGTISGINNGGAIGGNAWLWFGR